MGTTDEVAFHEHFRGGDVLDFASAETVFIPPPDAKRAFEMCVKNYKYLAAKEEGSTLDFGRTQYVCASFDVGPEDRHMVYVEPIIEPGNEGVRAKNQKPNRVAFLTHAGPD